MRLRHRCVLCLCAVVLVIGVGAAPASASTWMVGGTNLTSGEVEAKGSLPKAHLVVLGEISKTKVQALCTIGVLDAWRFIKGGWITRFRIILKSCKIKLNGTESPACEPNNELKEPGVIKTKELEGGVTSGGDISLIPVVGETYAFIEMGEECSIGEKIPLIGKLSLVDSNGTMATEAKAHTFNQGPLTELWMVSKTVEHKANIDGEIKIELFSGATWSALFP